MMHVGAFCLGCTKSVARARARARASDRAKARDSRAKNRARFLNFYKSSCTGVISG